MKQITTILFTLLMVKGFLFATDVETKAPKKGDIIGAIVDSGDKKYIEYATIALYKTDGKTLVTGGISDSEGFFKLKNTEEGNYYLVVTFMGYKTKEISSILIKADTKEIDLGKIFLESNSKELEGVDVVADQASVQYRIDRKVVNVSQQMTAKSGTAVDILENVPSVKVDIEGNVSLRGSTSFTVLIDGRPTVLEPSDALSQIPASAIENIEIITNPSAKYDPQGTAGIINIITKKNKLDGITGIVNGNIGLNNKYGGDATVDFRKDKLHLFLSADYNKRTMPGNIEYKRWTLTNADTTFLNSNGTFLRQFERSSIRGGFDYNITPKDNIGLSVRGGSMNMNRSSDLNYDEWLSTGLPHAYYTNNEDSKRAGGVYQATLDYKHNFNKKDHVLQLQINNSYRKMDESADTYQKQLDGTLISAKKNTESGPSGNWQIKLDYTLPLNSGQKIEAGSQVSLDNSEDDNQVFDYDTTAHDFIILDDFSYQTLYTTDIYAAYGIFSGEWRKFGYQAGLRTEYTYRYLELKGKNESYTIDQPDFFPTLHFSYNLPADQQTMLSYTRRIERPHGWELEPFLTWMDSRNVRRGNPGLQNEYVDSYEFSYQKKFKSNFVSVY